MKKLLLTIISLYSLLAGNSQSIPSYLSDLKDIEDVYLVRTKNVGQMPVSELFAGFQDLSSASLV